MQIRTPSASSQRAKQTSRKSGERQQGRKEVWHAVSIITPTSTCEAAAALRNHRFLSKDTPRLPLAGCSSPGNLSLHLSPSRRSARQATAFHGSGRTAHSHGADSERRGKRGRRSDDL